MIPDSARRAAESTLTTPCTVTRSAETEPTIDPDTLQAVRGAPSTVWSGQCTLVPSGAPTDRTEGDRRLAEGDWTWITSVDVPTFQAGDTITATDGPLTATGPWILQEPLIRSNEVLRRHRVVTQSAAARL